MGRKVEICSVSKRELLERKQEFAEADEEVWGWFSPIECRIYIYSGLEQEAYKRVLLHEITHAMYAISGLTNMVEEELEEAACDLNENLIELFLNKDFLKEIS
jgi:hypothetical protein